MAVHILECGIWIGLIPVYQPDNEEPRVIDTAINQIGKIPAVILYNSKSHKRGIGQSDLTDIADLQKLFTTNILKLNN
ncbi:MAG: hypothetical protein CM15mV87_070 [Caudoviricetes sp.]|nr:MAG: hypothetical protein CM15mV87_070 [Caudoviricetes sp.]